MADVMQNLSNDLANVVEAAAAGIVRVEGRKRLGASGIVWRQGVVVTAHHVIRRDEGVKVGLPSGDVVPATVAGRDPHSDIAVLKVDSDLAPLVTVGTDGLRVGNLVLAIGRPTTNPQATLGIISAIGSRRMEGMIQTDVIMYPGFSGGPLVDASGNVRGMNTSGFRHGASLAIGTATIDKVVDTLLEHGKMKQGYLGVGAQPVRLPAATAEELEQETGLLIASIEEGSPAEDGGLLLGDIIVKLDGHPTPALDTLLGLLGGSLVNATVPVTVVRGGQMAEISVTIGERG